MAKPRTIKWHDVDKGIESLETDLEHEIWVQREAIPLIFVPGIMGTRLRLAGTGAKPDLRWNPSSSLWMLGVYTGSPGYLRKRLLVGQRFSSSFLEVDNPSPMDNGFDSIHKDYLDFLNPLKNWDWGPLRKIFDLPVYAVGYNWTDSNENSGNMLADRIREIIAEGKRVTGVCEKVILITHSMGGLVSRWASQMAGAGSSLLGIIHGVQPATGAAAAYWRIKAGFEGYGPTSATLGNSGPTVTPVLGNIPGGLQLLPNKLHQTNNGSQAWLTITEKGKTTLSLPASDPYEEIYRVRAFVQATPGTKPSTNPYWGLVDAGLLNPVADPSDPTKDRAPVQPPDPTDNDALNAARQDDPWTEYLHILKIAETFHDRLGKQAHPVNFCARGTGHKTADVIELRVESNWIQNNAYPIRGFRGFFTSSDGKSMQAVLQDPAGDGDGTVPSSSAGALNDKDKKAPGDINANVEHQPAYQDEGVQAWAVKGILALCQLRYNELRTGDFPEKSGAGGSPV